MTKRLENEWRLWWAFMCSLIKTFVVSGLSAIGVDKAVAPVLMSLLSIVGPEVTFSVVLADSLAI